MGRLRHPAPSSRCRLRHAPSELAAAPDTIVARAATAHRPGWPPHPTRSSRALAAHAGRRPPAPDAIVARARGARWPQAAAPDAIVARTRGAWYVA